MDKVHEDLIDAWETEAMHLSQDCSLAWSDLENDPDNDRLPAYNAARGKLRAHLKRRPGLYAESCAGIVSSMWDEYKAAHPSYRTGYQEGYLDALDAAEQRLRGRA